MNRKQFLTTIGGCCGAVAALGGAVPACAQTAAAAPAPAGTPCEKKYAFDGYCLCPAVEKGPEGLSGTYCECSAAYLAEMFRRATERPVRVQLLESLKRGGNTCKFRIELG